MASQTELFLDDNLIDMAASVTRRIHKPRKHLLNPVLRPEAWWEGNELLPYTVLYDEDEKLFKMWCRCGSDSREKYVDENAAFTAYYTSTDGVHWDRPMLGALDFGGRRDHSVVFTGDRTENGVYQGKKGVILSVVRHPHPRDESEKYVGLAFKMKKRGAYLGTSPDGIHWKFADEPFWQTMLDPASWGDDQVKQLIYDKRKNKWVMYRRVIPEESERMMARPGDEHWQPVDRYYRVFSYADSDDLKQWDNYRIMMAMDADDPSDSEVYNLTCFNYEQVYVGYLNVYYLGAQNIDVQLVTSRNGIDFTRVCRRENFIDSGPLGYFDYMIFTSYQSDPVLVNDKVHIYYSGVNFGHDVAERPRHAACAVGLATLDRDRFVSIETGIPSPGRLVTKPFVVRHPNLFLNAATWAGGSIRMEILTRDWQLIDGFTVGEAAPISGNALAHPVRWKRHGNLGPLVGKEVRVKFYMENARVHAMTTDDHDRKLGTVQSLDLPASPDETERVGAQQGVV